MFITFSYWIITTIVAIGNRVGLVHWHVSGLHNLPSRDSGMILVCNHLAWHDIPLIGWALPRAYQPWWFGKHDLLLGWWYGWWVARMPIIPVKRGKRDRDAINHAIDLVNAGGVLIIFPEGTWDYSGKLLPAKSGASRIALHTKAPIVPMAIIGNHRSPWGKPRQLIIGEYFFADTLSDYQTPSPSQITQLSTSIMLHIARLLPPECHGYYASMVASQIKYSEE